MVANDLSKLAKRIQGVHSDAGTWGVLWWFARYPPNAIANRFVRSRSLTRQDLQNLESSCSAIWYLEDAEAIKISYSSEKERRLFGKYPNKFSPCRSFVCDIVDCHIVGPNAVALTNGNVITETVHLPRFDLDVLKRPTESHVTPSVLIEFVRALSASTSDREHYDFDCIFPLVCQDQSYYHWIVEYLPKIRLLEYYQDRTGRQPTILVEPEARDFILESLELVGYGSNMCREWDGTHGTVKHLALPSHQCHVLDPHVPSQSEYHPSRSELQWLRSRMRASIDTDIPADEETRIYVSRQEADSDRGRKVVNYDELMNALRDRGFKSYTLENLDFKEQIELFADARVVVGPHGAGLVNILFSDEPLLIELFPQHRSEPYFHHICRMFNAEYEPIVTEVEGDNLVVDVPSLTARLDELGV